MRIARKREIPRTQQLFKPVSTPTTQSTTVLSTRSFEEEAILKAVKHYLYNQDEPLTERLATELMYLYGLRVSEVLAINWSDVDRHGHIRIKGAKGSHNRVVISVHFNDYILSNQSVLSGPVFGFSRFYLYKVFKKKGFYHQFAGHLNYSVTHLFRHLVILELKDAMIDSKDTAQFIGHKNEKNTKIYRNESEQ